MSKAVVYVHGLWLNGYESLWLRRRLSRALGAQAHSFAYPSVSRSLAQNATALGSCLARLRADTLHLVAHSLGGLITLELFENGVELPPGRIVLLGSPVRGSRTAQRLARLPFGRTLLGATARDALLTHRDRRWAGGRDLGTIAGDLGLGLGRLLGAMPAPNDGTVLVEETHLPGATQRLIMPTSHSGMVFSPAVARQAAAFLRDGCFEETR